MACALSPVLLYCVHVFPRLAVIYHFEFRPQTLCCFILPDNNNVWIDVTLIVSKVRRVVMLEYENQLLLDAVEESQLFIFAKGIATQRVNIIHCPLFTKRWVA